MTSLTGQLLLAACGAAFGAGIFQLWRSLRLSRARLSDDLDTLYAAPPSVVSGQVIGPADRAGRWLVGAARRWGVPNWLLGDELALAGKTVEAHSTTRLLGGVLGAAVGLIAWILMAAVLPVQLLLSPFALLLGILIAVLIVDRRIRTVAAGRRREAQLAVAAYLDLVRILLVGGLPLLAALRAAADAGHGWSFDEIRHALTWAHDRGLPPDEGLRDLADRMPVPEFADLAITVASARRGASPVAALESKAAFMRGAASARLRAETAIADAQIELPAAAVALAFMFFLTYPLMVLITTGTGVLP